MNRREFLDSALGACAAAALFESCAWAQPARSRRPVRIVLRSSWQTVNIGDIAHTPGVLALLEKHLPEAQVRLWPSKVDQGVDALLQRRFPRVPIVQSAADLRTAFEECDFLLHGSGPSLVAQRDVARWHKETGKPFGVYGITLSSVPAATAELLSAAQFVFFRDSVSLELARREGVRAPRMEFAPDGAFAVDLRNDVAARTFLERHGLAEGEFLCCIPRLRYTPYWKIKDVPFDEIRHARNLQMQEHDHVPLRAAITAIARETPLKVLICPEDQTQIAVGKELLVDALPDDVRSRVVWRERYWLTDEALSTYVRAAGLFGLEMHSPIMCIGNGVPALVGRFAEQTSKGFMWRDIGLEKWLFDFDRPEDIARLVPAVLSLARDPAAAKAKAAKAKAFVERRQRETMEVLAAALN